VTPDALSSREADRTLDYGPVNELAWAPDGRALALAASYCVEVVDTVSWIPTWASDDGMWYTSVAFAPDGRSIATGSASREVGIWDAATGARRAALRGHAGWVRAVAFAQDSRTVASGSDDNTVRVWDAVDEVLLAELRGHTDWVEAVAFSPDGRVLASGGVDRAIRLWDVTTGTTVAVLPGHEHTVTSLAFGDAGSTLISGGLDGAAIAWNMETLEPTLTMSGHTFGVACVSLSPVADVLACASGGPDICLWSTVDGSELATLTGPAMGAAAVAYSPDGALLAAGGMQIGLFLWETGDALEPPATNPWDITGDGVVDIRDLITVATTFGAVGEGLAADVNHDLVVNIVDLVGVAAHFGESVAGRAPALGGSTMTPLVREWLRAANGYQPRAALPAAGMRVLERLAGRGGKTTTALAVYPNPANPEAWIPFRMEASGEVTVRIYAANGSVVRVLRPGWRAAGSYTTRPEAAYWDGRNARGERAAAGRYICEVSGGGSRAVGTLTLAK